MAKCENEKNIKNCNCSYPCNKKGFCCECIAIIEVITNYLLVIFLFLPKKLIIGQLSILFQFIKIKNNGIRK